MSAQSEDFAEFLRDLLASALDQQEITVRGRIESFDKQRLTATVKILAQKQKPDGSAQDYPLLSGVPVMAPALGGGFFIRPAYERGDQCLVAFSLRDVYGPARGLISPSVAGSVLHNAVVVGGLKSATLNPSDWSEDGLLIGHKDGDAYAKFADNEIKFVFGSTEIVMDAQGLRAVVGGATFDLVTHKHTTGAPGGRTSPPTPE